MFFPCSKRNLEKSKRETGFDNSDESIRKSVVTIVQMAFTKCGGDFNNPTLNVFQKVLEYLAKKSEAFGHPADIIEHHKKQMEKVLFACKKQCGNKPN